MASLTIHGTAVTQAQPATTAATRSPGFHPRLFTLTISAKATA